jgi:hypothetical protein
MNTKGKSATAWTGMMLRPFMQRVDDAVAAAVLDPDETPDMRALDRAVSS